MDLRPANPTDITGGYVDHDFVCEYYDHIFHDLGDTDFYIDQARESGSPVLELGTGSGRVGIPLARAGFSVTGMDLSSAMLGILKGKLSRESIQIQERVELLQCDIRNFRLNRKFPLIIIPFSTFQLLLDVQDQLDCLRAVAEHLQPGGTFIVSIFNESIARLSDPGVWSEFDITPEFLMPDGRKVKRRFRIIERDATRQVEVKDSIFYVTHPDGREERLVHRFVMRYSFQYELIHMMARVGLTVKDIYSDYKRKPFDADFGDGRLIVVARSSE